MEQKSVVPEWWKIVEMLQDPLMLLGSSGNILRVNSAALKELRYEENDLKYKSVLDIVHTEDRVKQVNNYIDISYGNKPISITNMRLKTSNNTFLYTEQILHPVENGENSGLTLLTFKSLDINNGRKPKWEEAQNLVNTIQGLTGMLDLEEFASSYNKSVINRIKEKLAEFSTVIGKKKVSNF